MLRISSPSIENSYFQARNSVAHRFTIAEARRSTEGNFHPQLFKWVDLLAACGEDEEAYISERDHWERFSMQQSSRRTVWKAHCINECRQVRARWSQIGIRGACTWDKWIIPDQDEEDDGAAHGRSNVERKKQGSYLWILITVIAYGAPSHANCTFEDSVEMYNIIRTPGSFRKPSRKGRARPWQRGETDAS